MTQKELVKRYVEGLQHVDLVRLMKRVVDRYKLNMGEIQDLLQYKKSNLKAPGYIFVSKLGSLESVVKYLKEELDYSYHKIAVILNRDDRTIWATFRSATSKHPKRFINVKSSFSIPLSILDDRRFGVLENIVIYMKDELQFRFKEIANLLGRDQRTIWTTYHRAKVKLHEAV